MENNKKQAILIVSHGTSYRETREKTTDIIESMVRQKYQDIPVYSAWTSEAVIRKLLKRDGLHINNVVQTMAQIQADGISHLIVQPTFVINGLEYDTMVRSVQSFIHAFEKICIGAPLLTSVGDQDKIIHSLMSEESIPGSDEALVLVGHGVPHFANMAYAALDYRFKDLDYPNVFIGTMKEYPDKETILRQLKRLNPSKVTLAPFMIAAGSHAAQFMKSGSRFSWIPALEQAGYEVHCRMKGLLEYKGIQEIFIEHIEKLI